MQVKKSMSWFTACNILFLGIVAALCLFPLYYVCVASFTDPQEFIKHHMVLFPLHWSTVSYRYLFSNDMFIHAIGVSAFLAICGTALSLIITAAGSYALSRKRLHGRKVILIVILLTTLFNPGIIPPYLVVRNLGLINSIWSLILPVLTSGWYVILMKGFFDSIPEELEEAAKIDGSTDLGIFIRIVLPLSLPALAAFGLFYAVSYWNTFFTALLYITDPNKYPLQLLLQNMLIDASASTSGSEASEILAELSIPPETLQMAAVVVATVPILLVYPFLQKHFAKGAMIGSIKG